MHPSGKCSLCRAYGAPFACVPDDQPQPEDYATRRQRIAAERNPGRHYDTCTGCGKFTACENGLLTMCDSCYAAWPGVDTEPPATAGIRRAVANLTRREPGVGYGSHEYQP
jgi:hypothetical protein